MAGKIAQILADGSRMTVRITPKVRRPCAIGIQESGRTLEIVKACGVRVYRLLPYKPLCSFRLH